MGVAGALLRRGPPYGRSPSQLRDDAAQGDRRAERQFREFAEAFKGARQLTWFGSIRELKSD
jgi:hypothetical protein